LTQLRTDIDLYPGTKSYEGLPTFVLHDKWRNKFINVGWLEYEIIQRLSFGDPEVIAASICDETTLYAQPEDIQNLIEYLTKQEFLDNSSAEDATEQLVKSRQGYDEKVSEGKVKLNPMAYFMFKVPLLRPNNFLESTMWMVKPFMSKGALYFYLCLFFISFVLVLQQWHSFIGYFDSLFSLNGAVYLFFALAVSKTIHEFGHAYTCKRYGLSVPTMGVMWMFIFGFLYTDTTESWKLSSRKKRVAIGSAGVLAELQLAVIATFFWAFMPDGVIRFTFFYLATAAWVATLLINLSPFLRWDGYWVLSDLLGIQNLRERSNKLCKWFFGCLVMGFDDEPEVKLPKSQVKFSIVFAILSWFYRVGIFVAIGLLIFERVFKLLGILLLSMMLFKMVLWPILEACIDWFKRRSDMNWNKYSISSFVVIFLVLLLLIIPWRSNIEIPGVLAPKFHIDVVPGVNGKVLYVPKKGESIKKSDRLFKMENPELTAELESSGEKVNYYELSLERIGNKGFLEQRAVDQGRLETEKERQLRAYSELEKLSGYAPYDGSVIWVNENAKQGGWVDGQRPILSFADKSKLEIYAFIGEYALQRVEKDGDAKFYPENPKFSPILGKVMSIDSANVTNLDYEILSSTSGGPITVVRNPKTGKTEPEHPLYLVRIQLIDKVAIPIMVKGAVVLEGERKSFFSRFLDSFLGTLIRESGF